jgi:hypothetical protein
MVGAIGYLLIKFNDKLSENRKATDEDLATLNADKQQAAFESTEMTPEELAMVKDGAKTAGIDVEKLDLLGVMKDPTKAKQDMTTNMIDGKVGELKGQIPGGVQNLMR